MTDDYSQYEDQAPLDKMEQLRNYVDQYVASNMLLLELDKKVEEAEAENKRIVETLILPLMDELKLEAFKTKYGFKMEVKEEIRGSILKDNEPKAFAWLRETGNAGLIKNEIKFSFGMSQDNEAKSLAQEFLERGLEFEKKEAVHASTLSAFVKEKLENGIDLPDFINVFRQRVLKVPGARKRAK